MSRLLIALLSLAIASATVNATDFDITSLAAGATDASPAGLASGARDAEFAGYDYVEVRRRTGPVWLRLEADALAAADTTREGLPVLAVRKGRHFHIEVYPAATLGAAPLAQAARWSTFRGREDALFVLPRNWTPSAPLYLRVTAEGNGAEELAFRLVPLEPTLTAASRQSQVIAAAVGALFAMALSALLIWFILPERLFVLYATLFALQGVYVAYLSGAGFDWPLLRWGTPLNAHAWNVPAALSGAAATLFVREIADLQRFSPRIYAVFGWLSLAFVALAFANLAHVFGFGAGVASLGNVLFLGTAVFTLLVALLAWLRGSRAAGWFLIAWGLLETATIATAGGFLLDDADDQLVS